MKLQFRGDYDKVYLLASDGQGGWIEITSHHVGKPFEYSMAEDEMKQRFEERKPKELPPIDDVFATESPDTTDDEDE